MNSSTLKSLSTILILRSRLISSRTVQLISFARILRPFSMKAKLSKIFLTWKNWLRWIIESTLLYVSSSSSSSCYLHSYKSYVFMVLSVIPLSLSPSLSVNPPAGTLIPNIRNCKLIITLYWAEKPSIKVLPNIDLILYFEYFSQVLMIYLMEVWLTSLFTRFIMIYFRFVWLLKLFCQK